MLYRSSDGWLLLYCVSSQVSLLFIGRRQCKIMALFYRSRIWTINMDFWHRFPYCSFVSKVRVHRWVMLNLDDCSRVSFSMIMGTKTTILLFFLCCDHVAILVNDMVTAITYCEMMTWENKEEDMWGVFVWHETIRRRVCGKCECNMRQ